MNDAEQRPDIIRADHPRCTVWIAAAAADRRAELLALVTRLVEAPDAAPPQASLVKESTVRRVWATALPGAPPQPVHVKAFRPAKLLDRVRDAVYGARARQEFQRLLAARRLGLPCVEPLACAVESGSSGARSFLITATAPGTPLPRGSLDAVTAAAAGRLLRAVHDAGLEARDLHPANVLAEPGGALRLLDLTAARIGQPLDELRRARGLAFFCLDLPCGVADIAARPLLAAYGADPALRARAMREDRRLRRAALRAFGRRATRACRHTRLERGSGGQWWYWHRPAEALHPAAQAIAVQVLAGTGPPPDKAGRRGAVHLDAQVVAKLRTAARATDLFRAAYWLTFAGVPVPQPVALCCAPGRGVVVFARIAGATAAELLPRLELTPARQAAHRLGAALGRMHAHGLRNRDLKFENLVHDGEQFVPVDLDGVRLKRPTDRRGEAADLGRLEAALRAAGVSHARALRWSFLRGYTRALACLQHPTPSRNLLQRSAARAAAWQTRHPGAAGRGDGSAMPGAASSPASPGC